MWWLLTALGGLTAAWLLYALLSLAVIVYRCSDVSTALTKTMPRNAWANQVVWITGAGSGLGETLAWMIAENSPSAKLILSSRNQQQLERVADACRERARSSTSSHTSQQSLQVAVLTLDLSDLNSIPAKVEQATQLYTNHSKIDVLINAAGVTTRCYAHESTFDLDHHVTRVNYLGPVCLIKHLMQRDSKPHTIVQLGSIAGKLGAPVRSAYSGSKFALHGWLEALGVEAVVQGHTDEFYILNAILGSINTGLGSRALVNVTNTNDNDDKNQPTLVTLQQDDANLGQGLDAEYCAERILAVAHAKEVYETWIAKPKELVPILYFTTYFRHTAFVLLGKALGVKYAVTKKNDDANNEDNKKDQ